jgi:hypothetical protein
LLVAPLANNWLETGAESCTPVRDVSPSEGHRVENAPLSKYQMFRCKMLHPQNFSSRCARIVLVQNEKIISLDGYVTIPGASLFKVAADYTPEAVNC